MSSFLAKKSRLPAFPKGAEKCWPPLSPLDFSEIGTIIYINKLGFNPCQRASQGGEVSAVALPRRGPNENLRRSNENP